MISVIIPCYNVEVYIERCIDSILSQTIVDELQVICIDDGSTDNTFNLLEKYRNKFHNIILIKQSNQGQSAARNKGLELATGEYVGFIDSDDWINSVYYEELLTAMNKNKSDIVFCCMETVHESGAVDPTNARDYAIDEFTCISLSSIERENVIKKFLMDRISVSPCNKLIKRDLVIDNNIKFSEGLYNEDMEFTFDLLMVSRKISKINDSIYSYWQREFSTTKASNYRALDMLFIVDRIKDKIYKANLQDKFLYEMVHFELLFSVYLTLTRLRFCKTKEKRKLVLTVCNKLDGISLRQISESIDHPIKRRLIFLVAKFFKKITSYVV